MTDLETERQQGKRLLGAMAVLFLFVPLLCGVFGLAGVVLLDLIWGGAEAVRSGLEDWTKPSEFLGDPWYWLALVFIATVAVGTPIWAWFRIFVRSGYISEKTNAGVATGNLPVVGGYLKPFMYAGVIYVSILATRQSIEESNIAGGVIFGGGGIYLVILGLRELLGWWRKQSR